LTLAEFLNELKRLHCIDGWHVPELDARRQEAFVANPVQFLLCADDDTQDAIWRAMERDRQLGPRGVVINLMDALRRTID